ncbi:hypothetical protein [Natrononativus amylolyticus]|uniref:hypothetical protein n=1 Tax=Natrononativus amylolyticus TaxID=2963434 RepID=UPI0020CDD44B|nr:hypothetical protein [Natrononativus amylolyticus]
MSFGRKTHTPDRYQETAIGEGDEGAVQGTVTETEDGPLLRGSGDEPPVLVGGDLERRSAELRRSAGMQLGLAGVMFTLAVATPGLFGSLGF